MERQLMFISFGFLPMFPGGDWQIVLCYNPGDFESFLLAQRVGKEQMGGKDA